MVGATFGCCDDVIHRQVLLHEMSAASVTVTGLRSVEDDL